MNKDKAINLTVALIVLFVFFFCFFLVAAADLERQGNCRHFIENDYPNTVLYYKCLSAQLDDENKQVKGANNEK